MCARGWGERGGGEGGGGQREGEPRQPARKQEGEWLCKWAAFTERITGAWVHYRGRAYLGRIAGIEAMSPSPDSFHNLSPLSLFSLIQSTLLCGHSWAVRGRKKKESKMRTQDRLDSFLFSLLSYLSRFFRSLSVFSFFSLFSPSLWIWGSCVIIVPRI